MRGTFEVIPVGKGVHGPFQPSADELSAAKAAVGNRELSPTEYAALQRSYPYVTLQAADGSGEPVKATYAPGLEFDPVLFKQMRAELEIRSGGKLRFHGEAAKLEAVKAA